jgi:ribonucleotide monophosphatase NagD (HAD superfamily)
MVLTNNSQRTRRELATKLRRMGIDVGEGRTVSFENVEAALNMVIKGAKLIATNLDPNCPTGEGTRPAVGRSSRCSKPPADERLSASASPAQS